MENYEIETGKYEIELEISEIESLLFFFNDSFDTLSHLKRNYDDKAENSATILAYETSRRLNSLMSLNNTIHSKLDTLRESLS